jgi:hypothetical protein
MSGIFFHEGWTYRSYHAMDALSLAMLRYQNEFPVILRQKSLAMATSSRPVLQAISWKYSRLSKFRAEKSAMMRPKGGVRRLLAGLADGLLRSFLSFGWTGTCTFGDQHRGFLCLAHEFRCSFTVLFRVAGSHRCRRHLFAFTWSPLKLCHGVRHPL